MGRTEGNGKGTKRLLAAGVSTVLILAAAEITIRLAIPDHRFLDRRTDCYWVMRLTAKLERHEGLENVKLDTRLGWTMRSSYSSEMESTNSQGIRSKREIARARTEGLQRIVLLGDSFTFGLGVNDDATFSARIEEKLDGVETLNMGVNGYGTDQQYLYWVTVGRHYSPDAVLLCIYVPDFHRNGLSIRELPKPRFHISGDELVIEQHPSLRPLDILNERVDACRSSLRLFDVVNYARRWLAGREADGPFDEKAVIMAGLFERMRLSAERNTTNLGIVIIPDQIYRSYQDHGRIERVIESAAAELGIPCLNLTEPLIEWQSEHPDAPLYDPSHGHWSEIGHDTAAEMLIAFIEANGLL